MSPKKTKAVVASEKVFAANFIFLLEQKNIHYLDFAKEMDVERHRVERWLKALCFPKYSMLIRLCDYFEYYNIYKLLTSPIKTDFKKVK